MSALKISSKNESVYLNFNSACSYEDRAKSLDTIVKNHKDATTYEEFTGHVFSPAPGSTFYSGPNRSSGLFSITHFYSILFLVCLADSLSGVLFLGVPHSHPERESNCVHSSQLAAALIDSHRHPSPKSSNAGLHDVPLRGRSIT